MMKKPLLYSKRNNPTNNANNNKLISPIEQNSSTNNLKTKLSKQVNPSNNSQYKSIETTLEEKSHLIAKKISHQSKNFY
jgi:hypothetical protein